MLIPHCQTSLRGYYPNSPLDSRHDVNSHYRKEIFSQGSQIHDDIPSIMSTAEGGHNNSLVNIIISIPFVWFPPPPVNPRASHARARSYVMTDILTNSFLLQSPVHHNSRRSQLFNLLMEKNVGRNRKSREAVFEEFTMSARIRSWKVKTLSRGGNSINDAITLLRLLKVICHYIV